MSLFIEFEVVGAPDGKPQVTKCNQFFDLRTDHCLRVELWAKRGKFSLKTIVEYGQVEQLGDIQEHIDKISCDFVTEFLEKLGAHLMYLNLAGKASSAYAITQKPIRYGYRAFAEKYHENTL